MKSMTGFGRSEKSAKGVVVALQVSSVNRKNLEVACSLPKDLQRCERQVTEKVRAMGARGRFQFSVEVRREAAASVGLPSDEQFDAALARLRAVAERHGARFEIDAALLAQVALLIEGESAAGPDESEEELVEGLLMAAADEALERLLAMRAQEGQALKADLAARRELLVGYVGQVKALAPEMVAKYREGLLARLEQAGLQLDVQDERVLREIALFADRCDISEETTRLGSHLEQYAQLLEKEDAVGRPLEFLLQEVGREINTTGSKATTIEISRIVLEMKNELERIREQVANVE